MRNTYYQPRSRESGKSPFLLPATLMLSAILIAFWALRPQATVKTYASEYSPITIEATTGDFQFELQVEDGSLPTVAWQKAVAENGEPSSASQDESNISPTISLTENGVIAYSVNVPEEGGTLVISGNGVTGLTFLEGADEVTCVNGSFSHLQAVDVSQCPNLASLNLEEAKLASLKLTNSAALTALNLSNNSALSYDNISNYESCVNLTASTITLDDCKAEEAIDENGSKTPFIKPLARSVAYTLTVKNADTSASVNVTDTADGHFFTYDELFGDSTTTKSVTLLCTAESETLHFVKYTFCVTIDNPNYHGVSDEHDNDDSEDANVTPSDIVEQTVGGSVARTISTTQTSNNGTVEFPAAFVSSSDETTTTTTTTTKADNATTKTDNSTTKADNSTTTTTKAGASKSLPVSNSDVIVGASVANGTIFVDGSGNTISAPVKITSTALDSTTLANLRAGLAIYGVKSDNSVGYDISLKANGYSTVKIKEKSGSVTVTLAYPSETVKANRASYTFTVYHQVSSIYDVRPLKGTATDSGVQFTTDSFSPFLLAWTVTGTTTDDGKSPKTGEDDLLLNLSLMMAILSVISLATILLKKKYTTAQETAGYESYTGNRRYSGNSRYSGDQYYPRNPRRRR